MGNHKLSWLRSFVMIVMVGTAFWGYQKYFYKNVNKYVKKHTSQGRVIETLYGSFNVTEPVLLELLDSPVMQRIKKVHQFGVYYFIKDGKHKEYTRYTHSVGVWALLRKFNAPLHEQIAGLLHDASHTVFSHVGDYLFKGHRDNADSYQDTIHKWYLKKYDVDQILSKHGFSLEDILHKSGEHKALEQSYPDICADRLEYNLKEGHMEGLVTKQDIDNILASLRFKDNRWYFTDQKMARKFAELPLNFTQNHWGSADNFMLYSFAALALKRAMDIKLVSVSDIHFSTDDVIWQKLINSKDEIIKSNLEKMENHRNLFKLVGAKQCHHVVKVKFRGIDPWVQQGNEFKRLSKIDKEFLDKYRNVSHLLTTGWPIKFVGRAQSDIDNIHLVVA